MLRALGVAAGKGQHRCALAALWPAGWRIWHAATVWEAARSASKRPAELALHNGESPLAPHLDMILVDAFRHSLCCWFCNWIASDCIENALQWSCADGLRAVLSSTRPCCFLYELFCEDPFW